MRCFSGLKTITGLLFGVVIAFIGCEKDREDESILPEIASIIIDPPEINPGETAQVVVSVNMGQMDPASLKFHYAPSGGVVSGDGAAVEWTAPDEGGVYALTVILSDKNGRQITSRARLQVRMVCAQICGEAVFPKDTVCNHICAEVRVFTSKEAMYYGDPVKTALGVGSGNRIRFKVTDLDPGIYFLEVWSDVDNDGKKSFGDYVGRYGREGELPGVLEPPVVIDSTEPNQPKGLIVRKWKTCRCKVNMLRI